MGCWSQRKFRPCLLSEKLSRRDCQHGASLREAQEWFEVPGMQHFFVLAGNLNFGAKHPVSLGRVPRTSSRFSVSRKDSTALFSAHTWKTTFLFCSAHDSESDFISPVPTEKRIITEHDHVWKHSQRPFAPVLTTEPTGLLPLCCYGLWCWGRHAVTWWAGLFCGTVTVKSR